MLQTCVDGTLPALLSVSVNAANNRPWHMYQKFDCRQSAITAWGGRQCIQPDRWDYGEMKWIKTAAFDIMYPQLTKCAKESFRECITKILVMLYSNLYFTAKPHSFNNSISMSACKCGIIIIILMTMFVVLSSCNKSFQEFTQFIWWIEQSQAVIDPQTKPTNGLWVRL